MSEENRIIQIMQECNIDWFIIKTSLYEKTLYDELRVHTIGEPQEFTATANEFEQPFLGLLKELELLVLGETS